MSLNKDLNNDTDIEIKNNDVIVVNNIENFKELKTFSVIGEISLEGFLPIIKRRYTFEDLLNSNSFVIKSSCDLNSIYILRDETTFPVKIDLAKSIEIFEDDIIYFPKIKSTVKVSGEVNNPLILNYIEAKNINQIIKKAGGFNDFAEKSNIYVVYPSGLSSSTRKFLFFNIYPKIKPGSELFVPKKTEKNKVNSGDLLAIATSLTSIVALLNIISN